jgi:hypothetical protein
MMFVQSLALFGLLVCSIILALTGFGAPLLYGGMLSGYPLLIHVAVGLVFIVSLLLVLFIYGGLFIPGRRTHTVPLLSQVCFWSLCIFSIPLLASILLSMEPLFGTGGMWKLLICHQINAIIVTLSVVLFTLFALSGKLTKTGD